MFRVNFPMCGFIRVLLCALLVALICLLSYVRSSVLSSVLSYALLFVQLNIQYVFRTAGVGLAISLGRYDRCGT